MGSIAITRAGPSTTIQDEGRFGMLIHGVGPSGPMDRGGFIEAGQRAGERAGAAIECSVGGLVFIHSGSPCRAGFAGGRFVACVNGTEIGWPSGVVLQDGDSVEIAPGPEGSFGYIRFAMELAVPECLGSRATNLTAALGGLEGRTLRAGDTIGLESLSGPSSAMPSVREEQSPDAPFRVLWGIHAQRFSREVREAFLASEFVLSPQMDRMGYRLSDPAGVFANTAMLSLVSDPVVAGDIQILGDGTPIVLMKDHQPTGGYPRIATIIDADLDRFAQLRPGACMRFASVTLAAAHAIGGVRP